MSTAQVGDWKLSVETSQQRVELGQPVTVKVILEGSGNVKNITPPRLEAPPAFKVYDPTTTDKMTPNKLRVQGRRTQEYLVMPQRTGTFTLPALEFPYFDPKTGRYEVSRTEPVEIVVESGAGGTASAQTGSPTHMADAAAEPKNVLTAGGLRPLRYQARFEAPAAVVWQRPFFLPAVLAPVGLMLALALGGLVRGRWSAQDEGSRSRQRARAARKQLAAAEKLRAGNSSAFYGEVEKALLNFLAARLRVPVGGLTRDALDAKLTEAGVEEARRQRVRFVLEACDTGRFAPGAEPAARERILDDAAAVMEGGTSERRRRHARGHAAGPGLLLVRGGPGPLPAGQRGLLPERLRRRARATRSCSSGASGGRISNTTWAPPTWRRRTWGARCSPSSARAGRAGTGRISRPTGARARVSSTRWWAARPRSPSSSAWSPPRVAMGWPGVSSPRG
ncbi:BatD family protein [Cystobacter fuscus]